MSVDCFGPVCDPEKKVQNMGYKKQGLLYRQSSAYTVL